MEEGIFLIVMCVGYLVLLTGFSLVGLAGYQAYQSGRKYLERKRNGYPTRPTSYYIGRIR